MILREKDRPIGIFDSGLGGLTVLKEIQNMLPNENLIYFGRQRPCALWNKIKRNRHTVYVSGHWLPVSKHVK